MVDVPAPRIAASSGNLDAFLRSARLVSGLVLMAFVVLHLINHSLNLISLEAAERGRHVFLAFWRSPPGTLLFFGAAWVHTGLALTSLYRRRTLAMPGREWAQLVLGLLIPLVIAYHVIGTRIMHSMYGIEDNYYLVVRTLWVDWPWLGAAQSIALVVVWLHGCLGLYFFLRYRRWYAKAAPWLLIAAVLLPVLSLLGFAHAGQTIAAMEPVDTGIDAATVELVNITERMLAWRTSAVFLALVGGVLAARLVRDQVERRRMIEVRYADGRAVRVPKGYSVLEASRLGGIAHYAVCGGRGRCSTCRIRVFEGMDRQPPPGAIEAATLHRIHAEPDVRLACQLKPAHDLVVAPLLKARGEREAPVAAASAEPGHEKVIAVMFCDMRRFTALADQRLPFDVVFLLNRYFAIIGQAVAKSGGHIDKFIGDGAMALFGLNAPPGEACRQAISAATAILEGVRHLSDDLAAEMKAEIEIAVGIHVGQAIVGTMGYGDTTGVTAIGDAVNIASRLEATAKELDAELVISEAAAKLSGLDFAGFEGREIDIRGRAHAVRVLVVPRGSGLPR
jgi:adenylate cyclase